MSARVLCRPDPCTQASSDEGSPPNAEFTAPQSGALRHNRIGRAGSPLPAGPFRVYGWRRVPHMRDAPYQLSTPLGRFGARPSWPQSPPVTKIGLRSFAVWEQQTVGNRDVAGLSTVLFLRAWTPARLVAGFGGWPSWPQVFCGRDSRAPANFANGNRTDA